MRPTEEEERGVQEIARSPQSYEKRVNLRGRLKSRGPAACGEFAGDIFARAAPRVRR